MVIIFCSANRGCMTKYLDIRDQPCYACGKGVAKVVHFVTKGGKDRFFYGCSASAEDQKCSGSRAWQDIQVPEKLRLEHATMNGIHLLPESSKGKKKKRRVKASAEADLLPGDELVVTAAITTKKAKKATQDHAKFWIVEEDGDFVP